MGRTRTIAIVAGLLLPGCGFPFGQPQPDSTGTLNGESLTGFGPEANCFGSLESSNQRDNLYLQAGSGSRPIGTFDAAASNNPYHLSAIMDQSPCSGSYACVFNFTGKITGPISKGSITIEQSTDSVLVGHADFWAGLGEASFDDETTYGSPVEFVATFNFHVSGCAK